MSPRTLLRAQGLALTRLGVALTISSLCLAGCYTGAAPASGDTRMEVGKMDDKNVERLERTLMSTTYGELFERQVPEQQTAIMGQPEAIAGLHKIVQRAASPMHARFLAAELLFSRQPEFPAAAEAAALPAIYAWAIGNQETGNMWGLPGDDDGQAGTHVVRLGSPVVAALLPLFQDERLLPYGGSIEATAASLWQVRIKDVAASLVARILKQTFPKQADKATRDGFIKQLASTAQK